MTRLQTSVLLSFLVVSLAHAAVSSADLVGTLSLDSLSFVAFQGYGNLELPAGSSIQFHFGAVQPDGSVPFTISPGDVSVAPIAVPPSATLHYGLASGASGTVRRASGGLQIT